MALRASEALIDFDIRGLDEFAALMKRIGDGRAEAIAQQAMNRIGRSVRRMVAEELTGKLTIKRSELNRLVWWRDGSKGQHGTLRFKGTGKGGAGFVRPRHLGLAVPKAGVFANGKPRFGPPTTSVPTMRTYFTGFAMVPGKGSKPGSRWKNKSNRTGRNLKPWSGSSRGASKVQLFRRTTSDKWPITQVPGLRLRELAPLDQMVEQAKVTFVLRAQLELERRLLVELNKKA